MERGSHGAAAPGLCAGGLGPLRAFWRAFAEWKRSDRRFERLLKLSRGPRVDLNTSTNFHVSRHGEDPRFKDTSPGRKTPAATELRTALISKIAQAVVAQVA
jgi:hypothetical protein